jgi:hypothetical protein
MKPIFNEPTKQGNQRPLQHYGDKRHRRRRRTRVRFPEFCCAMVAALQVLDGRGVRGIGSTAQRWELFIAAGRPWIPWRWIDAAPSQIRGLPFSPLRLLKSHCSAVP